MRSNPTRRAWTGSGGGGVSAIAVLSVVIFSFLILPAGADAAVTEILPWNRIAYGTTGTTLTATAPTVPKGSDKILVIALSAEYTANTAPTFSAVCDTATFTSIVGNPSASTQASQLLYLKNSEAEACSGKTIEVTLNGTPSGKSLFAAVYSGVDQTTPILGSSATSSTTAATSTTFGTAINVAAGGLVFYSISLNLTSEGHTPPNGYTETADSEQVNPGINDQAVAWKPITANGAENPTVTFTSSIRAIAAASLNPSSKIFVVSTCTDCHRNPPGDGPRSALNGTVIGSHATHVTQKGMACSACHVAPAPSAYDHSNLKIDMATGPTGVGGGYYDKNGNAVFDAGADETFAMTPAPVLGSCRSTACHYTASPVWGVNGSIACDGCHGYPPAGGGDGVAHPGTLASVMANHDECSWCHLTKNNGSNGHAVTSPYSASTHHGNGQVEMNSGVGYNTANRGCDSACHGNDASHRLTASGKPVNLLLGPILTCDSCHGYPPVTAVGNPNNRHVPGATPVDHSAAGILAYHDGCVVCHGTKNNGSNQHAPHANYNVSAMHNAGGITLNSTAAYNPSNQGCDLACHDNDAAHRLTSSGLTVDYFAGPGSDCLTCHSAYPPATGAHAVHAANILGEPSPPAQNPTGRIWDAATHPLCARCHDMSATANHYDTADHIAPESFDGASPSVPYSAQFTCVNASCHYGPSASWK